MASMVDRRALRKKGRSASIRQSFGVIAVGAVLGTGLFAIARLFHRAALGETGGGGMPAMPRRNLYRIDPVHAPRGP